jgi:hypothetical protein
MLFAKHKVAWKAHIRSQRSRSLALVIALGVAVIGVWLLFGVKAATPVTSVEAEAGARSGNVSVISGVNGASGGSAVEFGSTTTQPKCSLSDIDVPTCGALWGAYVPNYGLTTLENEVGRTFDIFQEYHDMSTTNSGKIPSPNDLTLMNNGQRILFATWASREFGGAKTDYNWQQISDGSLDATVIDPQAARIAAIKPTKIFLAFDSEMEGAAHQVDGSGADYVAAYRHIHDRMIADGATNIIWAWVPAGSSSNWGVLPSYYPGDAYVDWIGYDPYNFYSCGGKFPTWKDVSDTFGPFYNWVDSGGLSAVGPQAASKPKVLGEYGTEDDTADVTHAEDWYTSVPTELQTSFPQIKALMQWDSVATCDTRIDAIPPIQAQTLAGFTAAGHDPYVNQN